MKDVKLNFLKNQYNDMSDEKVIETIKVGDEKALEYIINKYTDLVNMKASKFFLVGAERGDIIQEGMIGLYNATKSFDCTKQNSFKTFANMCIERQMITAIKTANRQKNIPLNSAISINSQKYDDVDDNNKEIIEFLNTKYIEDPSETIAKQEYFSYINRAINESLSQHEKNVLAAYKKGKSYAEIAKDLNCNTKSVDTAISRIRRKANKIKQDLESEENKLI